MGLVQLLIKCTLICLNTFRLLLSLVWSINCLTTLNRAKKSMVGVQQKTLPWPGRLRLGVERKSSIPENDEQILQNPGIKGWKKDVTSLLIAKVKTTPSRIRKIKESRFLDFKHFILKGILPPRCHVFFDMSWCLAPWEQQGGSMILWVSWAIGNDEVNEVSKEKVMHLMLFGNVVLLS